MTATQQRWTLIILFITAFTIRLYRIDGPAINFHPARQYHSAFIVRAYFRMWTPDVPDWERQISQANKPEFIEPPIMEWLALTSFRLNWK